MTKTAMKIPVINNLDGPRIITEEVVLAEKLFRSFAEEGFVYDELSKNPDIATFASAELLALIGKDWIEETLKRCDRSNFLIYKIIEVFGPSPKYSKARFAKLVMLVDKETVDRLLDFIAMMSDDPPVDVEVLEKMKGFWMSWQSNPGV